MDLTRRNVLNALGVLTGASVLRRNTTGATNSQISEEVAQAASVAPPSAGLALVLRFRDGTSRTFNQTGAKEAGDYVGQFVHQKCFIAHEDDWTVFFRPDANHSRDEVVVERGVIHLAPGRNPTHLLDPYTATILKDGGRIAEVTVPRHWWLARWRWQSAPRPIRRSLHDLIAMKAICPLGRAGLYGAKPLDRVIKWQGPMDIGGLATGMGGAGERSDIGPITEYQAAYLLDGNAEMLTTLLTQAEAVGSMPIWARDQLTGGLADIYQMPHIAFSAGEPTIPQPPYPYNPDHSYNEYLFRMEVAHIPSAAYVPWLLTDDPYFYEGAEAIASYGVLATDFHRSNQKLPGLVYPGETRAWAWGMRELFRMGAFAPENPPSWLKPRSYWRKLVADNLSYTRQFTEAPAKIHRIFRQFTRSDICGLWQSAFVMSSLGWAVWSGFYPEWSEFARWFAGGLLPFANGSSGWDKRWPSPYYVGFLNMRDLGAAKEPPASLAILDGLWESHTPDSWAEAWKLFPKWVSINFPQPPQAIDPSRWTDANKVYENGNDSRYGVVQSAPSGPAYVLQMRAGLAFAALAGVPGARAAHDWLHAQLPSVCASYGKTGDHKWSFSPS